MICKIGRGKCTDLEVCNGIFQVKLVKNPTTLKISKMIYDRISRGGMSRLNLSEHS